ncbi:MAG: DUF357 domain-containing protein [Thermoplasmata archaeon]
MKGKGAVLTEEKVERYLSITSEALARLRVVAPERSFARKLADDFLKMARAYFDDAKEFYSRGDLVNSFACVNYAHGWLDCGARIGLFDVGKDDKLFTLFE